MGWIPLKSYAEVQPDLAKQWSIAGYVTERRTSKCGARM